MEHSDRELVCQRLMALGKIVTAIRERCPDAAIVGRDGSGFAGDVIMNRCERRMVQYPSGVNAPEMRPVSIRPAKSFHLADGFNGQQKSDTHPATPPELLIGNLFSRAASEEGVLPRTVCTDWPRTLGPPLKKRQSQPVVGELTGHLAEACSRTSF